jgi:hypothetical protein
VGGGGGGFGGGGGGGGGGGAGGGAQAGENDVDARKAALKAAQRRHVIGAIEKHKNAHAGGGAGTRSPYRAIPDRIRVGLNPAPPKGRADDPTPMQVADVQMVDPQYDFKVDILCPCCGSLRCQPVRHGFTDPRQVDDVDVTMLIVVCIYLCRTNEKKFKECRTRARESKKAASDVRKRLKEEKADAERMWVQEVHAREEIDTFAAELRALRYSLRATDHKVIASLRQFPHCTALRHYPFMLTHRRCITTRFLNIVRGARELECIWHLGLQFVRARTFQWAMLARL